MYLVALDRGKAGSHYLALIEELPFLKRLIVPTYLDKEQLLLIKEHVVHNRPEIDEEPERRTKEKELKEDKSVAALTAEKDKSISFEIINQSQFIYPHQVEITVEVLGGVSGHTLDRLQVTLKIMSNENSRRSFQIPRTWISTYIKALR